MNPKPKPLNPKRVRKLGFGFRVLRSEFGVQFLSRMPGEAVFELDPDSLNHVGNPDEKIKQGFWLKDIRLSGSKLPLQIAIKIQCKR